MGAPLSVVTAAVVVPGRSVKTPGRVGVDSKASEGFKLGVHRGKGLGTQSGVLGEVHPAPAASTRASNVSSSRSRPSRTGRVDCQGPGRVPETTSRPGGAGAPEALEHVEARHVSGGGDEFHRTGARSPRHRRERRTGTGRSPAGPVEAVPVRNPVEGVEEGGSAQHLVDTTTRCLAEARALKARPLARLTRPDGSTSGTPRADPSRGRGASRPGGGTAGTRRRAGRGSPLRDPCDGARR